MLIDAFRRTLPPVVSTVAGGGVARAVLTAAGRGETARGDLEALLRRRFGAERALLTDSGTSALALALRLAARPRGAVALPGYACIDLTAAALFAGVRVRLYDVDPRTLSPDLDSVRAALRRGVDAVVVAHLFGVPADVPGVRELADEHGATVIEDAAQGAAGTLGGGARVLGSFGPYAVLSFGRGKGTTGGSGGALLATGEVAPAALDAAADALRSGGSSAGWKGIAAAVAQWALGRPRLYGIPSALPFLRLGEMVYHAAHEPSAIGVANAALAADAMRRADAEASARRAVAEAILSTLGPAVTPCEPIPGGCPGYLRLPLLGRGVEPAHRLGILRSYPLTLAEHPQIADILLPGESAGPGSAELRSTLLTAPVHGHVRPADVAAIGRWARGGAPARLTHA